ncbi:MAG: AAC(3) family N-acetyltransferase [Thermodesulfobacteriota bacterium]|nr:AAC(3) family N-acetyltransferase [Thermodesulfobacteriota bacterium]
MGRYTNYISYKDAISKVPINAGDTVQVSSSVLRFMCACRENGEIFDANLFIDSVMHQIGPKGTLIFPTYNWDFCRGVPFDVSRTPSQAGALGNTALKRADFRRTQHPIYSFAVSGHDKDHLCGLNDMSAFGPGSPFAYMYEKSAKHLFLGIDYKDAFTLVHHVEEKVGVPYRYLKDFSGEYVTKEGSVSSRLYKMYVREPSLCRKTEISPRTDEVLLGKGFYSKCSINGIPFGLIDVHGIADVMEGDIRDGASLVYPIK